MTRNANTARIARDTFAANAIRLLNDALAHGLGARITVDPHGVETHADLFDGDGAVLLTHQLHATQLALPLAPQAPAPSQPPPAVEASADAAHPLAVGDRIILDGVAVEVLGVDRDGFIWRTTDGGDFEEGDVEWSAVRRVVDGVWAPRRIDDAPVAAPVEEPPPVEAPKPAKKPRAKKASASVAKGEPTAHPRAVLGRWTLVEGYADGTDDEVYSWPNEANARDMMANAREADICTHATLIDPRGAVVDTYAAPTVDPSPVAEAAARPGLWLLVEHPVGAAPVEMRHEERLARRFFEATAKHGGDGLRRVELFDADGLLVDSHNFAAAPAQPARGLDGVPASVRDLSALSSPGWWCVVAQPAVRPDLTEAKLCTDESTATAMVESLRAADMGSNSLTRVVVFNADGAVHAAWHRHEPAVCEAVEAHQGVELFRVTVGAAGVYADTPPAEWGASVAPCRYAESHMRNSPAEVSEGPFSLHWHPDVAAREVYAIVPRALVAVVVRRCTTWGGGHHPTRVTPELDAPSTALRAGSSVVVGGETWSVLLIDLERAVLTRGDEVAEVALGDVHPSGTDAGWWADRVKPKAAKAEKKAPKRAKAVA